MRSRFFLLAFALALLTTTSPALAHGMRTGTLRVDEATPTRSLVRWSTTVPGAKAEPVLPPECTAQPLEEVEDVEARVFTLECPEGLAGRTFAVRGLGAVVTEATVFVQLADGRAVSSLVTPDAPSWTVPKAESAIDVARSYVGAGLAHILSGADHVLFLALLVLLLRRTRAVLLAETAFTVSHSLAFAATSLGWIHVRPAPVEACIALSLVLLALDVRARPDARAGRAAAMALVFGLVHGLGFAGGLREAGLPDAHAAVALAGFGAGVEIGQLAVLAVFLGLTHALARIASFPRFVVAAATAVGGVSTAWLIERIALAFV